MAEAVRAVEMRLACVVTEWKERTLVLVTSLRTEKLDQEYGLVRSAPAGVSYYLVSPTNRIELKLSKSRTYYHVKLGLSVNNRTGEESGST